MSRKKVKEPTGFALFNVVYEDGTLSSNRKIALAEIDEYGGDNAIKAVLEAQDRKIAEASGRPRGAIKSVSRSDR